MTYERRSPRILAASRKSRLRKDKVCARSWFAPYDQPVTIRTISTTGNVPLPAYVARMMISGNVGITRKMLMIIDRTSSPTPRRYAADTPTITDSSVANAPATTAITSDSRVPYTSCAQMSWPSAVVPSQCAPDGDNRGANARSLGCRTDVNNCGTAATTQNTNNMPSPTWPLRLRRTAPQNPPRRRATVSTGGAPEVSTSNAVMVHALARERGSSTAIANSHISSASNTATVNSMNSACMSG